MGSHQTGGVLVAYNPDASQLFRCVSTLLINVDILFVVANSRNIDIDFFNNENVRVIINEENIGVASGFNKGIFEAMRFGCSYILLSDQDTLYPVDYVNDMRQILVGRTDVAAVMPVIVDSRTGEAEPFVIRKFSMPKKLVAKSGEYELFHGISSGTLMRSDVLNSIGVYSDELFVDWVDFEWCWRAREKGFKLVGLTNIHVLHSLGDGDLKIGKKMIRLRNYQRTYYLIRNAVHLSIRSRFINRPYKFILICKAAFYLGMFPLVSVDKCNHLKSGMRGLYDGLVGKMGPMFANREDDQA